MSLPWYLHKSGQKLGLNPNRLSRPSERHPASSSCLTSPATFPHPLPPPLPNKHETYIHSYKQSMHNQILTARSAANPIIWLLNQGIIYWDTEMVPVKVKLLCWCVGDNPTIQLFSNDHPPTIFYFQLWNLIVILSCFFVTDCDVLINFFVAKCGGGGGGVQKSRKSVHIVWNQLGGNVSTPDSFTLRRLLIFLLLNLHTSLTLHQYHAASV